MGYIGHTIVESTLGEGFRRDLLGDTTFLSYSVRDPFLECGGSSSFIRVSPSSLLPTPHKECSQTLDGPQFTYNHRLMSVLLFFVFSFRSSYIGLDLGFTGVRVGGWMVERLVLFVTRQTFQVNIRVPSRVLNVIWAIPKSSLKYFLKVKVKSLSRVRLFATWGTAAHQAPPSMGFSRQEYWSGLPFLSPGDLPDPGIEPRSPALQADAGRRFNLWTTRYIIHIPYSLHFKVYNSVGFNILKMLCHYHHYFSSVQFSSVAQPCPTLCDPMDCSTPGFHGHHQLLEPTQTHVHRVGDAIQPSHLLSSPSPPAFSLSQHQGLFQSVSSSHQVAKLLVFQLQHQSLQWIFRTGFL